MEVGAYVEAFDSASNDFGALIFCGSSIITMGRFALMTSMGCAIEIRRAHDHHHLYARIGAEPLQLLQHLLEVPGRHVDVCSNHRVVVI